MVEFRVLGSPSLVGSDGHEARSVLQQPKRLGLLTYLVLTSYGSFQRRDRILGVFWPDSPEDKARASLATALVRLRDALGVGVIIKRGKGEIGIDPEALSCDAAEFLQAVDAEDWPRAAEVYGGPLLDGFFLDGCPDFDTWLEHTRAHLKRTAVIALVRLTQEAMAAEDDSARALAERAYEIDPLDGGAVRSLMEVLARAGQRDAALRVYERYATSVREERGIEPSPETVILVQSIREGRLGRRPSPEEEADASVVSPAGVNPEPLGAPSEVVGRLNAALGGRYHIVRQLGGGGMATVYLARDEKHNRKVALKVLKPELAAVVGAERFLAEIETTAKLQHPHILPLFDSGEADGFLFYAMPYVEGESLRERLNREHQLPVDEAVQLANNVAEALEYAHRQGVIHRDIKPANILLSGAHAVVADFGIAKALTAAGSDSVTQTGVAVGTPSYMSPEQALGQELDGRSDIYSLACVLYEVLAGSPPFIGPNALAALARHALDTVPPLRTARPAVSAGVAAVIEKALAKAPADRWPTAREFIAALESAEAEETSQAPWWMPGLFTHSAVPAGAIAIVVLFGLAGVFAVVRDRGPIVARGGALAEAADAIAVLPFEVRGTAPQEWGEGVVDLLSTGLDGAGGLRAISSRTVLARWNELIADTLPVDETLALEVARRTGARYALLGSAVGLGPNVRLVGRLHDLQEERQLGQVQADGGRDEVLAVMDRLAVLTLEIVLREEREDVPRVALSNVITSSVPALKAYLEGESLLRRGRLPAAIETFQDAVRIDSLFALAYYGLFRAASFEYGPTSPLRIDAREKAFELIDRLPAREALLVRLSMEWKDPKPDKDFPQTVLKPLEEAVVKYPEDADIWHELAEARLWVLESVGSWEAVREPLLRATELAPKFAPYWIQLIGFTFVHDGDSAVVAQRISDYESASSDARSVRLFRITADLVHGDSAHRAAAVARLDSVGVDDLNEILWYLTSPRRWEAFTHVAEAIYRNGTRADKDYALASLGKNVIVRRGRLRDGLRYLDDPILPAAQVRNLLYWISMHGIQVPAERIEALGPLNVERAGRDPAFLYGVYAADQERWADHRAASARLDALADLISGVDLDSFMERRRIQALSAALDVRASWRRGQTEDALMALRDTLHNLALDVYLWAGRMARETGRFELAARHYEHFMLWRADPLVSYELGQTYERLGERQRAQEAYELFRDAWAEADPEFQPLVEDARRRLRELANERSTR